MMRAKEVKIFLEDIQQAERFIELSRKYEGDVDVYSTNRNYLVDGKSVLGVLSLGLNQMLTVKVYGEDTEQFICKLKPFARAA